jgi:release factor glutamine methyltransferase
MRPVKAAKLLTRAEATLKSSPAIDHWQQDRELIEAEELLLHVLGEDPDPDQEIPTRARQEFEGLVARRAEGEPIPYIKGYSAFRDIELIAQPGVFVPRDSSEWLAEQAIRRLRGRKRPILVDLATGGGTIALAVADEVPMS